jgi:hypothetical protein
MEELGEYYISFDTEINPGKIDAVRVRIDVVTIDDMKKPMRIDLCSHPLYKELRRYVESNR